MRILIFNEKHEVPNKFIEKIKSEMVAMVDYFNDYEEAEYCAGIRNYDYIFVHYEAKYRLKYLNFFKDARDKNKNAKIILFGEKVKEDHIDFYKKFNLDEIINQELTEIDMYDILKQDNSEWIERGLIKINVKEKKVWIKGEKEDTEITFKKKIDFYVFLYFVRHYKETINVSNLLDATCEEPELTKDSIIESSISSLRKTFKELLHLNPIKAFKKVGYEFSIS